MPDEVMQKQHEIHQKELISNLERSTTLGNIHAAQLEIEQHSQENIPYFLRSIPYLTGTPQAAPQQEQVRQETDDEKKQRKNMEKQYRKARAAEAAAVELETSEKVKRDRRRRRDMGPAYSKMSWLEKRREKAVLDKWLTAIQEKENADLEAVELFHVQSQDSTQTKNSLKEKKAEIRWKAQEERTNAYRRMAMQMPLGSTERKELLAKVEEETVKTGKRRQIFKVACMPEGREKKRELKTIDRHEWFDRLKLLFRKPTPYSHEEAVTVVDGVHHLINTGRATMGGTKAMYTFEDVETGEQWLYKEATNCVGMEKTEGAIVTQAASELQRLLRGEWSIPARTVVDDKMKVVGSIQRRVQKVEGGVDLFKWQADITSDELPATTRADLLKEHVLDWVLCNFDTKGENFINQENGHIISFDKEASFNKLLDDGSRHMSYTYKPHSNDTIYNTIFRAYAEGKIDLDLNANLEAIEAVEEIAGTFVARFEKTLEVKFGKGSKNCTEAKKRLRSRILGLRAEYCRFYTGLIRERIENVEDEAEKQRLREMIGHGGFHFTAPAQPAQDGN